MKSIRVRDLFVQKVKKLGTQLRLCPFYNQLASTYRDKGVSFAMKEFIRIAEKVIETL